MATANAAGVVSVHRDPAYALKSDGLSPTVIARYEALVEQRDTAFAAVRASFEKCGDLRAAKLAAEGVLRELESFAERSMLFTEHRKIDPATGAAEVIREPDTARLEAARHAVEVATDRLDRALNQHDSLSETNRAIGHLVGRIEAYLSTFRHRIAEAAITLPPKLAKGETPATAVERVRASIAALKRDAKSLSRKPVPVEEAKARARAIVDELASRPDVAPLFRGGTIRWPMTVSPLDVAGNIVRSIDGAALLAFAFKPALIKALDAEIDAVAEEITDALPSKDRAKQLAAIESELLDLGYAEEGFILLAADQGHQIAPRGNADPRAVLGLDPSSPKPRE